MVWRMGKQWLLSLLLGVCWVFESRRKQARGWSVSSIVHRGVVDDTPAVAVCQNHGTNTNKSMGVSLATCTSPACNLPAIFPGPE